MAPGSTEAFPLSRNWVECGPANCEHHRVRAWDCGYRITRVDRPLKRVGALHRDNVGDLRNVEHRRNAWHVVLTGRGGRRNDVAVAFATDATIEAISSASA